MDVKPKAVFGGRISVEKRLKMVLKCIFAYLGLLYPFDELS
jgi:hypothetical protein